MYVLISMWSGQASTHLGSLQFKQRRASIACCSKESPLVTSSHPWQRSAGSAIRGICRGAFGFLFDVVIVIVPRSNLFVEVMCIRGAVRSIEVAAAWKPRPCCWASLICHLTHLVRFGAPG